VDAPSLLIEACYAIGIGLVVGFEREHHDLSFGLEPHREPDSQPADEPREHETILGARTFALIGLVGWLLALASERMAWVFPAGLLAIASLVLAQHLRDRDVGLTTEVAALVVALLGGAVHVDAALAVGLGLITTFLLAAKPWTRSMVVRLRRIEVTATIQLMVLVAIVLPLLPSEPLDMWDALPPRKVGMFVVLLAGVQYVGYVLTRVLGSRRGVGLTGLLGGLGSSTAVTVSMSRAARETPDLIPDARLAVFLANLVMPVRVVVITWLVSPATGLRVAIVLAGMVVVLLGAALWQWRSIRSDGERTAAKVELSNPLSLWSALSWGAVLCAVLFASKLATFYFGQRGFLVAALVSGLADVDAVTLASAEQASDQSVSVGFAALAIAIAVTANTVTKAVMAVSAGGRRFGLPIAVVFGVAIALMLAAGAVGALA
jgi:uncharacterized membrane protein (DUF4010 family)